MTKARPLRRHAAQGLPDAYARHGSPSATATRWSIIGRVTSQAIVVGGFIALSRLMPPEQFGVVGIATIFTGFALIFTELGLGPAIVSRSMLTAGLVSTASAINVLSGLLLALVLLPAAWPLAAWLNEPSLRWVLPVSSLAFVLSFGGTSMAVLERLFRFKAIAAIEVTGAFVSQCAAVTAAAFGHGLVGLAASPGVGALTVSVLSIAASPVRPAWQIDRTEIRFLRSYAVPLVGANSFNYWARNLDNLLIAGIFGTVELAFYSRAYQLMVVPVMQVNLAIGRVLQPRFVLDRQNRDVLEVRHRIVEADLLRFGGMLTAVLVPNAVAGVVLIFGTNWRPMGELLAILALSMAPQLFTSANGAVLRAMGDTRLLFRLGVVNSLLLMISLGLATAISLKAVAWTFVVHAFVVAPLTAAPVCKHLQFSGRGLAAHCSRALAVPAALLACLWLIVHYLQREQPWVGLSTQALATLGAGILVMRQSRSAAAQLH